MAGGSRVPHGVVLGMDMGNRITTVLQGQELGKDNRSPWFGVRVVQAHGGWQVNWVGQDGSPVHGAASQQCRGQQAEAAELLWWRAGSRWGTMRSPLEKCLLPGKAFTEVGRASFGVRDGRGHQGCARVWGRRGWRLPGAGSGVTLSMAKQV